MEKEILITTNAKMIIDTETRMSYYIGINPENLLEITIDKRILSGTKSWNLIVNKSHMQLIVNAMSELFGIKAQESESEKVCEDEDINKLLPEEIKDVPHALNYINDYINHRIFPGADDAKMKYLENEVQQLLELLRSKSK